MNNFLIKLTPLTPYFFGGENTFGDGKINYFARSNYLPQQTTILGMLRHQLLVQNNLIGTDPIDSDWKSLIGEDSFQKKDGKFISDFGIINKISPVFLADEKSYYITQSLDWAYSINESKLSGQNNQNISDIQVAPIEVDYHVDNGFAIFNEDIRNIPVLTCGNRKYDPKLGLKSLWVDSRGERLIQWEYENPEKFKNGRGFDNGVFVPHSQIGIQRILDRKRTDKGDFYKQVSYKLVDGFSFAFFAEINLSDKYKFESRNIIMGGEKTVVRMEVNPINNLTFESIFSIKTYLGKHSRKHPSIVLLSDSLCVDSVLENCSFSINESINFKNIITQQKKDINYAAFHKSGVSKNSENLKLFRRGSVFYPCEGKMSEVENAIKNDAFSKIGYNKYLIINS
ncbi:CRISPR-associated protein [anaerobic digester metagenome]